MKILVASHNNGKINEFKELLEPRGYTVLSAKDMGISMDDVEETGTTFAENARIKAEFLYKQTGTTAIADDSGLTVVALPDILGIYSARFMGEDTPYIEKNKEILTRLEDKADRSAYFNCAIALVGDNVDEVFEGQIHGTVADRVMGFGGFGYDPIFVPNNYEQSFGQLSADEKNKISHRALATEAFIKYLEV
ncbi:RdgB/HAM1 family non-canonical purine NTP pyrophosphatase [Erysipelothrix sp. HDW6C]|uniref:RdgB/HAM1 family non-canonical purine NTP pyrophosphatase n=1 Tax=Erysipelothrix sp. HDW6C TaxID=2714930 RepID=UPI0014099745|nr:RdgB/HAM1 family non-canonical purine NTP pyrophosphatase [Erysipelothrix sp. HDW6C]QIK70348.1 RdgB/HAM1 family non-canonical purine NTP pyrophosphatase [Erysipelothrix sp. HDW6C]